MNKLLALFVLLTVAASCVIIRFPETMHVDVNVPEDFTQKDVEVIIDTLKNGKLAGVIQVKINKKSKDQKHRIYIVIWRAAQIGPAQ